MYFILRTQTILWKFIIQIQNFKTENKNNIFNNRKKAHIFVPRNTHTHTRTIGLLKCLFWLPNTDIYWTFPSNLRHFCLLRKMFIQQTIHFKLAIMSITRYFKAYIPTGNMITITNDHIGYQVKAILITVPVFLELSIHCFSWETWWIISIMRWCAVYLIFIYCKSLCPVVTYSSEWTTNSTTRITHTHCKTCL